MAKEQKAKRIEVIQILRFGARCAEEELFSNLTFSVSPGQWCWLRGENGSGKSTLLKMIAGLLPHDKPARLFWRGKIIPRFDPEFLQEMVYLGHNPPLHPELSPLENLKWLIALQGRKLKEGKQKVHTDLLIQVLKNLNITDIDLPSTALSFGQKQRVSLARLFLSLGALWILDEPCTGLDEDGIRLIEEALVTHLAQNGMAIIASQTSFKKISPSSIVTLGKTS